MSAGKTVPGKHVCILGAGVIGLTTAWWLQQRGYSVTIIDRQPAAGREASFGNGGQLSYNFVAPLASPDTLRKLPSLLLANSAPIRIKPSLDPDFLRWGLEFLKECRQSRVAETTAAQLALGALSRAAIAGLTATQSLNFGLRTAGKLILHRTKASFDSAKRQAELQKGLGTVQQLLTPQECLEEEPGLRIGRSEIAGGVFSPEEQVADCALFCTELTERLRQLNTISWHLSTTVLGPILRENGLAAIETTDGLIEADLFVLCLGSGAPAFARKLDFRLPIYPMKGYSITAEPRTPSGGLRHSVTDFEHKLVFAPLGDRERPTIRVAGIADFVGLDARIDSARLASLVRQATAALDIDSSGDHRPWTGLRPATPDSRPIIGWSPVRNLFLNTGHGGLGWTLACGSAQLAAELIDDDRPSLRSEWFALNRKTARE